MFNFFNSNHALGGLIFAPDGWKNILFLRCDFYDAVGGVFSFNGDNPEHEPTGILLMGSSISMPETWETRDGSTYGGPSRLAVINNQFGRSGNHQNYFTSVNRKLGQLQQ